MREIKKIKYTKVSDIDKEYIYAFRDGNDISFLCVKDSKYFWKPLSSVHYVWYEMYDTIEKAVDERKCGKIMKFGSLKEFLEWANNEIK